MDKLEQVMVVHVRTEEAIHLNQENGDSVVMIPFSGYATGPWFEGEIEKGATDTQIISADRSKHSLSARYIMNGKDHLGDPCKLYIENNGNFYEPNPHYLFRTYPRIITSSAALKFLEQAIMVAEGTFTEKGLQIKIYRVV